MYDPTSDSWSSIASMEARRSTLGVAVVRGIVEGLERGVRGPAGGKDGRGSGGGDGERKSRGSEIEKRTTRYFTKGSEEDEEDEDEIDDDEQVMVEEMKLRLNTGGPLFENEGGRAGGREGWRVRVGERNVQAAEE